MDHKSKCTIYTIKLLKEALSKFICDFELAKYFRDMTAKAEAIEETNRLFELH